MVQSVTYQRETRTVPFQGKTIVLESLTPGLTPGNIALRGYQWYNILIRLVAPFPQERSLQ